MDDTVLRAVDTLRDWMDESRRAVFFGGAGVSTESGIPDFRSENGIFAAIKAYGAPPETLLSHSYFLRHTERFFDYYRKFLLCPNAKPNNAHLALAKWEKEGKLAAVVTQNIDGLHQAAGSQTVYELHGSVLRNHCMDCGASYPVQTVANAVGVPRCDCGGIIKPDVVLYEEGLNQRTLSGALSAIEHADLLIVGGTSLAVYPAAGLIDYFHGKHLVLINLGATERDAGSDLVIRERIGQVLGLAAGL